MARAFRSTLKGAFGLPGLRAVPPFLERVGRALAYEPGADGPEEEAVAAAAFVRRPRPVLVDGGANAGRWTRAMLRRFPDAERVVMFEPQPHMGDRLAPLLSGRVRLEAKALSDRPGTLDFWVNENPELSSAHRRSDFASPQALHRVEAVSLDGYLAAEGIERVDFLKLDLEGHETAALRGAARSIEARRIGAVAFEFGLANINSRTFFLDFWEFFAARGWVIDRILPGGRLERVAAYAPGRERFAGLENYVASPGEPSAA